MEAPRSGLLVNGVLKGGGAKGIAYAGALKAAEERGVRFGAVAGASAGAITAALVSAGLSASEVGRSVPDALKTLQAPFGVATEVAPWVGRHDSDLAIRVPHPGLSTTVFTVPEDVQAKAVKTAHADVGKQLNSLVESGRLNGLHTHPIDDVPDAPPPASVPGRRFSRFWLGLRLAGVVVVLSFVSWVALSQIPTGAVLHAFAFATLLCLAAGGGMWYLLDRARNVASKRAWSGLRGDEVVRPGLAKYGRWVGAALAIAGVVVAAFAMNVQRGDSLWSRVVTAERADNGALLYEVRAADDIASPLEPLQATKRHLRLGEVVLTRTADSGRRLANPFSGSLVPVSLCLLMGGLLVFFISMKLRRFVRRSGRVQELLKGHGR